MRKIGFVGLAACIAFAGATGFLAVHAQAPASSAQIPNLAGIWDGSGRARPVNSETVPWGKDNFPVLNDRALAYQKVFDEALSPKYDCQPATPPAHRVRSVFHGSRPDAGPGGLQVRKRRSGADRLARRTSADGARPRACRDFQSATTRTTHCSSTPITICSTSPDSTITTAFPRRTLKKVHERYWREGHGTQSDRHRRRRDVSQKARVVHRTLAAAASGLQAVVVGLRSRSVARTRENDAAEVQVVQVFRPARRGPEGPHDIELATRKDP